MFAKRSKRPGGGKKYAFVSDSAVHADGFQTHYIRVHVLYRGICLA